MIEDSLLNCEFQCLNFSSYYIDSNIAIDSGREFRGGSEEDFNTLISDVLAKDIHFPFRFPCFGKFQDSLKMHKLIDSDGELSENHILCIVINTRKENTQPLGQYCWMSVEELINHINVVKLLFDGFEFTVKEDKEKGFMKVKFLFKGGEITYFKIRFLLTWMRYSYEWAISMATRDAYILLNNPKYMPELEKEDIFNLIQITDKFILLYILGDQVIDRTGVPMDFTRFKERVNNPTNMRLNNDIYIRHINISSYPSNSPEVVAYKIKDSSPVFKAIPLNHIMSIAWWEDLDSFEQVRLPRYKYILEYLKKLYEYEPER